MTTAVGKRKQANLSVKPRDEELFVDAPVDGSSSDGDGDSDTTDSEESTYSGLEEEDATSSEEERSAEEEESESEHSEGEDSDTANNNPAVTSSKRGSARNKGSLGQSSQRVGQKSGKKSRSLPGTPSSSTSSPTTSKSTASVTKNRPPDEYDFDSSDEEDIRTTVGNIPMEWYREFEHLGYDWEGKKVGKPKAGDELDKFLSKMDDPNYWRSVHDKTTGQDVVLSNADIDLIERMKRSKYTNPSHDEYKPWIEFFTYKTMAHPVTNRPEHKRSFIPSKWERLKVGRMVHAIKMGWMKPDSSKKDEDGEDTGPKYYLMWDKEDQSEVTKRYTMHIPAPKMGLPGHEESYNPPPEYLLTEEEELAWKNKEPEERKLNFIPQKYSTLRRVPAYSRFINERFERCLDLYLCPRQRKMRMNVDPEDLLPKLPKPRDLQPFPTTQSIIYRGHEDIVRSISVDPTGQWLISGSEDRTVKAWEVSTGRCMNTWKFSGSVKSLAWNPNPALCLVAVVVEHNVTILNPQLGDKVIIKNTDNLLASNEEHITSEEKSKVPVTWDKCGGAEQTQGLRVTITHPKKISEVTWHGRGDYFAVVMPDGGSMSVLIHQLSKRRSQNPFRKPKGLVQSVRFHPTRPFLFMATQRYVRVYNLLKQELSKKLQAPCKWISSLAVHPSGDNVIVGSYDCKLSWFDLDLSSKPYQTLRHHKRAIRHVCFHKSYPLFASASDDGTVIVCHGKVYNDLLQNALVVPVKVLRGHSLSQGLGVMDCQFHPTQPWIFSCAADHTVQLYT